MDVRRSIAGALLAAVVLLGSAGPATARSPSVAALQVALRATGDYSGDVDGLNGPGTAAGVRRLQARRGLAVDGVAGPATRRALRWRGRPRLGSRALVSGRRGWDVSALQFLLATRGFASGPIDGGFGGRTDAALRKFQAWAGLGADGVAGPATIRALRRPAPRSPLQLAKPVASPVGDGYGPRGNTMHEGLDLPAAAGARVGAAGAGTVQSAGWAGAYGRLVVVRHRAGVTTYYAHLSRITVSPGEAVSAGERIGLVGSTGRSTGPHLHFEVRLRGAAVNPLTALGRNPSSTSAPHA